MKYTDVANDILGNAAALNVAVTDLPAQMPARSKFITYGFVMACMAQIDLVSKVEFGPGEPQGGQTARMRGFMTRYLDPAKADEHRVAVKLMRHTLMHTGEFRYLYEPSTQTGYTWRLHFADTFPLHLTHYSLTNELLSEHQHLVATVGSSVTAVKAFNINITALADQVQRATNDYVRAMATDTALQAKCEAAYPEVVVGELKAP